MFPRVVSSALHHRQRGMESWTYLTAAMQKGTNSCRGGAFPPAAGKGVVAPVGASGTARAPEQSDEGPEVQPRKGTGAEAEQPGHGRPCWRCGQEPAADDHGAVPKVCHTQGMACSANCTHSCNASCACMSGFTFSPHAWPTISYLPQFRMCMPLSLSYLHVCPASIILSVNGGFCNPSACPCCAAKTLRNWLPGIVMRSSGNQA